MSYYRCSPYGDCEYAEYYDQDCRYEHQPSVSRGEDNGYRQPERSYQYGYQQPECSYQPYPYESEARQAYLEEEARERNRRMLEERQARNDHWFSRLEEQQEINRQDHPTWWYREGERYHDALNKELRGIYEETFCGGPRSYRKITIAPAEPRQPPTPPHVRRAVDREYRKREQEAWDKEHMFNVDKSKIARLDRDENSKRKAVKNSSDWTVNPPKGYVKGKW